MKEKHRYILVFLLGNLAVSLITVCILFFYIQLDMNVVRKLDDEEISNNILSSQVSQKLSMMKRYIDDEFYFAYDIDAEEIYKDFISELGDEYSIYYTKEEYEVLQSDIKGKYCGVGIVLVYNNKWNCYVVKEVFKEGSAYNAGIKAGDKLLEVDGVQISNMDIEDVQKLIRGEEDTAVKLLIQDKNINEYVLHRDHIITNSVQWQVIDDDIGYICFSEFSYETFAQYQSAMKNVKDKEILIIDLRDNMGGSLEAVIDILQDMMPEGTIVSVQNKSGNTVKYESDGKTCYKGEIVVLVNEYTASAAEVFAAALQDNRFAVLIGDNTFGKGVVQTIYELYDGSAIKLTTGEYYTPNGRSIQGVGIQPDVTVINDLESVLSEEVIKWIKQFKTDAKR